MSKTAGKHHLFSVSSRTRKNEVKKYAATSLLCLLESGVKQIKDAPHPGVLWHQMAAPQARSYTTLGSWTYQQAGPGDPTC